jgi:hypothetical protein
MMKGIVVLVGGLLLLSALPFAVLAEESDAAMGERLVRGFFVDLASAKMAKGVQSVHQDGARDRDTERKTLAGLNLKNYTLSDFKVTREGNVLIVTYTFAGHELIDGKPTSGKPAPRMSIFVESGKEWLWVAHANLNPIKPSK